jgi:DNA transformation protein
MSISSEFFAFVREQFAPLGLITSRRMFSGAGVYIDGMIVALLFDDELYFKTDDTTRPAFEAEGCAPFGYDTKDGRRVLTSYWKAPERLFDEPDEMQAFARAALGVSRRMVASSGKPRKSPRKDKRS